MLLAAKVQAFHISNNPNIPNQLELAGVGKMSVYDMCEIADSDTMPVMAQSRKPFPFSLI